VTADVAELHAHPGGRPLVTACRCPGLTELYGREAEEYAAEHLVRDETRTHAFEELFTCPDTGRRWLLDYPERSDDEPGQARLQSVA
jgi:hypothetical protein